MLTRQDLASLGAFICIDYSKADSKLSNFINQKNRRPNSGKVASLLLWPFKWKRCSTSGGNSLFESQFKFLVITKIINSIDESPDDRNWFVLFHMTFGCLYNTPYSIFTIFC